MTMQLQLDTHIINPQKPSIGSVIWMHGLGADNRDFDDLIPSMCAQGNLPLRFIFPNAPIRPVTINQQQPMRAWYDIFSLTDLNKEDGIGISTSQALITQLILQEIARGTPPNRIVLAGFSQGGAMALYTGVRQQHQIAGILALSCYLPLLDEHEMSVNTKNIQTPIFIAHGTHDETLPCFIGKLSHDIVRRTHNNVEWREYAMGHEIIPKEADDIGKWLSSVMGC